MSRKQGEQDPLNSLVNLLSFEHKQKGDRQIPYIYREVRAGRIIEIKKYHAAGYTCKGKKRGKKENLTIEAQKKVNVRQTVEKLRWLLNTNFKDGDYWVELDYKKERRPESSADMQNDVTVFLRKLRGIYKKQGIVLKYVYCKERGPRGAAHVHIVMNRSNNITDALITCWTKGGIHIDPLTTHGDYSKIADYMVKYALKTEDTDRASGELIGKRYYPSHGLRQPVIIKRVIRNVNTFYQSVKKERGYSLIKDSVVSGITEAGYGFFAYMLHKISGYNDEQEGDAG